MASEALKIARLKRREAADQRIYDLLTQPAVLRLGLLVALLGSARLVRDTAGKDNMGIRDTAAAAAGIGSVLLAADAGIRDRWALAAIAGATGIAVGSGKAGVIDISRGSWEGDALIRVDPTRFSGILGF